MNKKKKWIITAIVLVVFCLILGLYNLLNDKAPASDDAAKAPIAPRRQSTLNVNGRIVRPQRLTDGITTVGNLLPDEEVDLSFETSGKIVAINFQEGTVVRKGELLAKVNDLPLVAQLSRYEAQLKLAEDRVYRQSALLKKDAVSQEAYEQARTELAMLNADIDIVKSNIALTELRAPFDGVIGLRNVSEGAYASPSVVVAKLTKISPLKIDFLFPNAMPTRSSPARASRSPSRDGRSVSKPRFTPPNRRSTSPPARWPSGRSIPIRGANCCRDALRRCRSACTKFPTPSPSRPRPSCRRWASTRYSSTREARRTPRR